MILLIDIPEDKYEWLKKNNPNADTNSIVGAIANGIPYEERPQGEMIMPMQITYQDIRRLSHDKMLQARGGRRMKVYTYYEPMKPNTVSGYSIKVTTIYSSFNKEAIDALSEEFKKRIGSGLMSDCEEEAENDKTD